MNKKSDVLCLGCNEVIHPKRLEILPKTKFCVKCSDTGKKRGVTVQLGEGDHTYNDIVIMEEKEFNEYMNYKNSTIGSKPEIHDFDVEDIALNNLRVIDPSNLDESLLEE